MVRQRDPAGRSGAAARRARLSERRKGDAGERAKAAFLSVVSHELRTPLNTILGQADLLAGDNLPAQSREAVKAIRDAGHGLHALINDLLQLARLESSPGPAEQTELDVRVLIDGVRRLCRPQAWAQNLDLEIAVDRAVPHHLIGDVGRIRQTLMNLAGNALKFTERGGISISAEMTSDRALKFSVADTGIGIEPGDRERLFAPFEQADHVLTRRFGGLGLGLALCKRLVATMRGTIGVESERGVGSTFWFTVPVSTVDAHCEAFTESEDVALDAETVARARHARILVADDNALHRAALARAFDRAGIVASFVVNGLDAVAAAGADNFDAIVLDAHMPLAGGLQAARMIRTLQRHGRTPILLACAEGDPAEAESTTFCDGIIRKPYVARAVIEALILAREGESEIAAFDSTGVEELEQSVGRQVLIDVLKTFLGSAAEMLARIEAAAPAGDAASLEQAARDLAGASGGLGLAALTAAAKELSAAARIGAAPDMLAGQAQAVAGHVEEARKRLTLLYPDLRPDHQAA